MGVFAGILNLITIAFVCAFFAFVYLAYVSRPEEQEYSSPLQVYKDMSMTRQYDSIRMTEPIPRLLYGDIGKFQSADTFKSTGTPI
jgi:hypothetical protein